MEWWMWPLLVFGLIVLGLFVIELLRPGTMRTLDHGLERTEDGLGHVQRGFSGVGFALTAFVTLPVLGLILAGWIGLAIGLVIGVLVAGRR